MQYWLRSILVLLGMVFVILLVLHIFIIIAPIILFVLLAWFFVSWFRRRQMPEKTKAKHKDYVDVEYRVKK